MSLLAILEHATGGLRAISIETLAAAQELGRELGRPVQAAIVGQGLEPLSFAAAAYQLDKVWAVEHELLAKYTFEAFAAAAEQVIRRAGAQYVLLPHTYQVRDFAPRLATRFGRVLVSDVVKVRAESGAVTFVRQLFQGKLNADYRPAGEGPHFGSIQAGSYRAEQAAAGTAPVETFAPELDAAQIRTKPGEPFRESARAVDLSAAPIIVSAGRGIKEQENLKLIEELAQALGAEIAASRPICDNGWLPMERQVGSSGQTVAPKLYLAVGISGAIQHLVGMKGSRTVVAINKDPNAPIFEVADIGIVGDLFEVVPALTEAIRKAKS
jgi:electron transfer flavoprotein alpha subunit